MNTFTRMSASILLSVLAGCGSTRQSGETPPSIPAAYTVAGPALASPLHRTRVALDLVTALRQVQGLSPDSATLDIHLLQGPFGETLKRVFAAKGYRSSTLAREDVILIQYRANPGRQRGSTTVILSAGRVKLKRDYELVDGEIQPASLLYILGAPADSITPDDSIFSGRDIKTWHPRRGLTAGTVVPVVPAVALGYAR